MRRGADFPDEAHRRRERVRPCAGLTARRRGADRTLARLDHALRRRQEQAELLLKGLDLDALGLKVLPCPPSHSPGLCGQRVGGQAGRRRTHPGSLPPRPRAARTSSLSKGLRTSVCAWLTTVLKPVMNKTLMSFFLFIYERFGRRGRAGPGVPRVPRAPGQRPVTFAANAGMRHARPRPGCPPPGTASDRAIGREPGAPRCGAGTFPERSCGRRGTRTRSGLAGRGRARGPREGSRACVRCEPGRCVFFSGRFPVHRTDGLLLWDGWHDHAGVRRRELVIQPHEMVEAAVHGDGGALEVGRRRLNWARTWWWGETRRARARAIGGDVCTNGGGERSAGAPPGAVRRGAPTLVTMV